MAETLTVALRVAEEAIEEAIAKAEEFSDSLVRHPSLPLLPLPLLSSASSFLPPTFQSFRIAFLLSIPIFSIPYITVMASYFSSSLASLLVSVSAGYSHGFWQRPLHRLSLGNSHSL